MKQDQGKIFRQTSLIGVAQAKDSPYSNHFLSIILRIYLKVALDLNVQRSKTEQGYSFWS
jgi:hypothetical protein